jgi:hypothetical protein
LRLLTAISVAAGLLAGGCIGGSTPSSHQPSSVADALSTGTVTGRVFTRACGGPVASSCGPTPYRGVLVFCRTMNEIGFCPSVRVDARGHYRIRLEPGRWAVLPAPESGNVVGVRPRWVTVGSGKTTTLDIRGGTQLA